MTPLTFPDLLARFESPTQHGHNWRTRCPAHDDTDPSLDIADGDRGPVFLCRSAHCAAADILKAVGLSWADVLPERLRIESWDAAHVYRNRAGAALYEVRRKGTGADKVIRPYRPVNGQWKPGLTDVARVPYQLHQVRGAVFVVEGEKAADALWAVGRPATTNVGGAGNWKASDTAALLEAGVTEIVILPDHDDPGRDHARKVSTLCQRAGLKARIVELPGLSEKGDICDWFAGGRTVADLDALVAVGPVASVDPSHWGFAVTDKGSRLSNLHNVSVALSHDPTLVGLVWYDAFLDRLLTAGPTGAREWRDDDDTRIAVYLQDELRLTRISPGMVHDVLAQRARDAPRHCVLDWLDTLTWDGVPRVADAFLTYWGAVPTEDQPEDYLRAAGANFLISLIARVRRPGCKVDTMPIFEGPQGIFKSSALEVLGGAWHVVNHESVTTKDFFQVIQGAWIVELGELDTITRAEVTRVKSVVSTRVDRYRKSYGRSAADYPRQCVFAGTTNTDNWGRDDTGLRRFWPVKCGLIDIDGLRRDRAQLLAEAAARFATGASWWEMPLSTAAAQHARQAGSIIGEAIAAFLVGREEVTTLEIARDALKSDAGRVTPVQEHAIARALRLDGWTSVQRRHSAGSRQRIWVRTPDDEGFGE